MGSQQRLALLSAVARTKSVPAQSFISFEAILQVIWPSRENSLKNKETSSSNFRRTGLKASVCQPAANNGQLSIRT